MYLVTGGAGFIGSNIVDALLARGEQVRVFDNFSTGKWEHLESSRARIEVIEGDLRNVDDVAKAVAGVEVIFHQAALRSVPRSVDDPLASNDVNVTGTMNLLLASRNAGVRRLVYASSSSVYGDSQTLPKVEAQPTVPVSPYAASKLAAEHYCRIFSKLYGLETVSLRYFNVFGPRQDPESKYSAVIPRFMASALAGEPLEVHGDGLQSRDFTFVENVVEANLQAAVAERAAGEVMNVACGQRYTLIDIIEVLESLVGHPLARNHQDPRPGDVRHTLADISKAEELLDFKPKIGFREGLERTFKYFTAKWGNPASRASA